jgi:hypothetical protein
MKIRVRVGVEVGGGVSDSMSGSLEDKAILGGGTIFLLPVTITGKGRMHEQTEVATFYMYMHYSIYSLSLALV